MSKIVSIPLFQLALLFIGSSALWFVGTEESKSFKKKIFNLITDGLYYFVLMTLTFNIIFNWSDILNEPYQIILFSSESSWIALITVSLYLTYRESQKEAVLTSSIGKYLDQSLNFFLFLGLANHLFYYYKYRHLSSVLFLSAYLLIYLLKDRVNLASRNEWALIFLALIHFLIMIKINQIVIYYQIVFYPYQIISLLLIASFLVFYLRRKLSSKQI